MVQHLTPKDEKVTVSDSLPHAKHSTRHVICEYVIILQGIDRQVVEVLTGHKKSPTEGHMIRKGRADFKTQALHSLPHCTEP